MISIDMIFHSAVTRIQEHAVVSVICGSAFLFIFHQDCAKYSCPLWITSTAMLWSGFSIINVSVISWLFTDIIQWAKCSERQSAGQCGLWRQMKSWPSGAQTTLRNVQWYWQWERWFWWWWALCVGNCFSWIRIIVKVIFNMYNLTHIFVLGVLRNL